MIICFSTIHNYLTKTNNNFFLQIFYLKICSAYQLSHPYGEPLHHMTYSSHLSGLWKKIYLSYIAYLGSL